MADWRSGGLALPLWRLGGPGRCVRGEVIDRRRQRKKATCAEATTRKFSPALLYGSSLDKTASTSGQAVACAAQSAGTWSGCQAAMRLPTIALRLQLSPAHARQRRRRLRTNAPQLAVGRRPRPLRPRPTSQQNVGPHGLQVRGRLQHHQKRHLQGPGHLAAAAPPWDHALRILVCIPGARLHRRRQATVKPTKGAPHLGHPRHPGRCVPAPRAGLVPPLQPLPMGWPPRSPATKAAVLVFCARVLLPARAPSPPLPCPPLLKNTDTWAHSRDGG